MSLQINPDDIKRISNIYHADPGFCFLAIFSLIEAILIKKLSVYDRISFHELLDQFNNDIRTQEGRFLSVKEQLHRGYSKTNGIRHRYNNLDRQDIRNLIPVFLEFCRAARVYNAANFNDIEKLLKDWSNRKPDAEEKKQIQALQHKLKQLLSENQSLTEKAHAYETEAEKRSELEKQVTRLKHQLLATPEQKNPELRDQIAGAEKRIDEIDASIENSFADYHSYATTMTALSDYTRARILYDMQLMKLTEEQEKIAAEIPRKPILMIKGSAGTGKSLLLLKGLQNYLEPEDQLIDSDEQRSAIFLTFTKSLTNYSREMWKEIGKERVRFLTVTGYLREIAGKISGPVDTKPISFFLSGKSIEALGNSALSTEIEDFIFWNNFTYEEYVDNMVDRSGLKVRLSAEKRKAIWELKEEIIEKMHEQNIFSFGYLPIKIMQDFKNSDAIEKISQPGMVFLDEAQDTSPVAMQCLKRIARHGLILAGDADQTLYAMRSPFARAGIDLRGNTRILKLSFRTTKQILRFSEYFRNLDSTSDKENMPEGFRDGPLPELYESTNTEKQLEALAGKVRFYTGTMKYELADIMILLPGEPDSNPIVQTLEKYGLKASFQKEQIEDPAAIRLTTFHSSKGLSSRIVILWLAGNPFIEPFELDSDTIRRRIHNLLYVGITRPTENLSIFWNPDSNPHADRLKTALEKMQETE